jgi:RND family efflux transporter MFP subunit
LTDTVVRAPFEGVIQERRASPGEYLMEGAPIATVVRIHPIRLRLEVPERESISVQKGQRLRFRVDGDTNVYTGEVDRVSPAISADNRMLQVEADIANANGRLRPGGFVRGEITTASVKALMVPRNTIVMFAGVEKIFVYKDGKADERRVTTGPVKGNEVEILKGVKAGEQLIVEPGQMRAGQAVRIGRESTEAPNYPNG